MTAAGLVASVVVGGGCGNDADESAAKTEEAVAEGSDGDADVDSDRGTVEVPDGEGGTFEVDEDGNVEVIEDDGSTQVASGDDATLPEGWPATLALPAGAEILSATTSTEAGSELLSVSALVPGPVTEAAEAFGAQLAGAGYAVVDGTAGASAGSANVVASDEADDVVATFSTDAAGATVATISITPSS